MRILHTSDWHLGRTLEGSSRLAEQREFINTLCDLAEAEDVHLILVTGDVFDTFNPPAEAENLFFSALERLCRGGRRGVVVIAGNHDSPERIRAASPLALDHGICLVGYPLEELPLGKGKGGVERVASGPGWLELKIPGCEEHAVVGTLAYPSEARLNELLTDTLEEEIMQQAYSERVKALLRDLSRHFRRDTINLLMSHLYIAGGKESDSERPIQLGGALAVAPAALPETAHYIALGHLHRPQAIEGAPAPCRYAGSPLAYSFSEADHQKEVVLIEAQPGAPAILKRLPITCGRPLKIWQASSLEEFFNWCQEERNLHCWVDLEIEASEPLSPRDIAEIRRRHPGVVNIRVRLPETLVSFREAYRAFLPLKEQFRLFAVRELGSEPPQELVDLFLELVNTEEVSEEVFNEDLQKGERR
ncbi:Exodeoxyribonuclease I subunit D [Thermanaeromonas toyohensis ToBE]|uniref:Nuclease SbcCD subunit D n=1 Tax=Thermanaeromonas toyohensis ToBE TaxID=698762 RepID=A0A1W1W1M0_9FIRM|nr:exonuclease subunit SbcD [Thermanaeromonas toyohensis]SMB99466.1 Exodeoxyribonuclease I subunit D [Thermanaeromonas toyohensis ToBE]